MTAGRIAFPITTPRLTIRPMRLGDAPALHEVYSDPEVMRHLESSLPATVDHTRGWVQDKIDLHETTGLSLWAIKLTATGEVIGDGGLQLLEDGTTVEVGMRVARRHWGARYGTEAAEAIVAAGFAGLDIDRIVGITDPDNAAAAHVMLRSGMRRVGVDEHYGRSWAVFEVLRPTAGRRVDELATDLQRLSICSGDTLMVHASLRAIGPTEGRAAGVVAALDEAVGPDGTLLMVLGARDDWAWVNDLPEPQRHASLADAEPFDALQTPADPDVGMLAEVFRTSPGTLVSNHPEGRFAARGRRAAEFTSDVPWNDYYGPGSPLERLVDAGGKVLRLGADPDTVTLLHYAEYLADVPSKHRVRRHRRIAAPEGATLVTIECLDDSNGIATWEGEDYFALITKAYIAGGRAVTGRVGDAHSELIDARNLIEFGVAWMEENLTRH